MHTIIDKIYLNNNIATCKMKEMSVDISYYIRDFEIFRQKIDKEREQARFYYLNGIVYVVVGILIIITLIVNLRGENETK